MICAHKYTKFGCVIYNDNSKDNNTNKGCTYSPSGIGPMTAVPIMRSKIPVIVRLNLKFKRNIKYSSICIAKIWIIICIKLYRKL